MKDWSFTRGVLNQTAKGIRVRNVKISLQHMLDKSCDCLVTPVCDEM